MPIPNLLFLLAVPGPVAAIQQRQRNGDSVSGYSLECFPGGGFTSNQFVQFQKLN